MKSIIKILIICLVTVSSCYAKNSVHIIWCQMPRADFKYNYMDTMIRTTKKPSDSEFLKSIGNAITIPRLEFYLWYVYKNPRLTAPFFDKIGLQNILDYKSDSTYSILWIMYKQDKKFKSIIENNGLRRINELKKWRKSYKKNDPYKSFVLSTYANPNMTIKKFSSEYIQGTGDDIDLILKEGNVNQLSHNYIVALIYYTEAASYGYQGPLVGAALLLPRLGGHQCLRQARYYILLGGVLKQRTWWFTGPTPVSN